MDKVGIPRGYYCHDVRRNTCVYWSLRDELPHQENGYCFLIDKSDWEINEEAGMLGGWYGDGSSAPLVSAHEIKMSLLWDKCKGCGNAK